PFWPKILWLSASLAVGLAFKCAPALRPMSWHWRPKDSGRRASYSSPRVADSGSSWRWDEHIILHARSVRVALCDAGICDADLEPLTARLDALLTDYYTDADTTADPNTDFTIDLSRNCGISDYGVDVFLVPFLKKWPFCRRLKLYQTSIGDKALYSLSSWVADGHAHELHLSDLRGAVSGEGVLALLRAIHSRGRYPYRMGARGRAPLWLRLEHNGIDGPGKLALRAAAEGLQLRVLTRGDMATTRPGSCSTAGVAVNMVLFTEQGQKALQKDSRVVEGQQLLTLLHQDGPPGVIASRPEPKPLSMDEFQLQAMEAREDAEGGADHMNKDTFGEDAPAGWTFEENLEANERIAAGRLHPGQVERGPRGEGPSSAWTALGACAQTAGRGPPWPVGAWSEEPLTACSTSFGAGSGDSASVATSDGSGPARRPRDPRTEIEAELCVLLASAPVLRKADFDGLVRQHLHAIRTVDGREGVSKAIKIIRDAAADKKRADVERWSAYISVLLKRHVRELRHSSSLIKTSGPHPSTAYQ
ncbi:unnamed protein product, partial [Prorocentrum cordatum]